MSEDHTSLLLDIERKDRRFRMAQSIFMALLTIALAGLVWVSAENVNKFNTQSEERRKATLELQQATLDASEEQRKYIRCIAEFFAREDRANLVISDLDDCEFTRNIDKSSSTGNPGNSTLALGDAYGGTQQGVTYANPPVSTQTVVVQPQPQPTTPPAQQPPVATAPPDPSILEALGLPVCVNAKIGISLIQGSLLC